eukprot:CAMPEP_0174755004 /NCGR_PEP_ID=MMETSP1094-20130205/106026_1 /TAXON_ID=156173 /ORGANISM="Chrysochromulina brevifilum, Strain UTEX LB 985" /LENGTH=140 /DNA_ID=CAMNT_0015960887 /DNA_START=368 /DNA_END=788 /DNA_ORIENTATION=+
MRHSIAALVEAAQCGDRVFLGLSPLFPPLLPPPTPPTAPTAGFFFFLVVSSLCGSSFLVTGFLRALAPVPPDATLPAFALLVVVEVRRTALRSFSDASPNESGAPSLVVPSVSGSPSSSASGAGCIASSSVRIAETRLRW